MSRSIISEKSDKNNEKTVETCNTTVDSELEITLYGSVNFDNLDTSGEGEELISPDQGGSNPEDKPILNERHLQDLNKSGLSAATIVAAGLKSVTAEEAKQYGLACQSGMLIPYPGCDDYFRLKTDSGEPKYLSPAESKNHLYIPPGVEDVLKDPSIPLVITEGEKKALRATQEGFPTIGLSGVWNWKTKEEGLLPEFRDIKWKSRRVNITFDSDLQTNSEVQAALRALTRELEALNGVVRIVLLPSIDPDEKVGLDDFLVQENGPAKLRRLIESAPHLLDAVLDMIVPGLDPGGLQARLNDVYRAGQMYEATTRDFAQKVREKMEQCKYKTLPNGQIERAIRDVPPFRSIRTGADEEQAAVDMEPEEAARAFVDEQCTTLGKHITWFYRGRFHRWTGTHYKPVDQTDFETSLMRWLQEKKLTCKKVFAQDVVANIGAMVHLNTDEEPSFKIVDASGMGPAVVEPRKVIACSNHLIAVDAVKQTCDPEPHCPEWFNTSCLPYEFDPEAECPMWEGFLSQVLEEDDQRIKLLQEMFGYCLLGDLRFQKFFILLGNGSNGKSVVLDALQSMLGGNNVSNLSLDQFNDRFALGCMEGKMANICADLKEIDYLEEGIIKKLTSGDTVQIDRKFKDLRPMKPTAVLVFSANKLPNFRDRSDGIWRRLVVIPFDVVIKEQDQDKQLAQDLHEELPGIFNWALKGLFRLVQQKAFTHSDKCSDAGEQHRHDSDHVIQFLEEAAKESTGSEKCNDVYRCYSDWASDNGFTSLNSANFGKALKQHRPEVERKKLKVGWKGKKVWAYQGIKLKDELRNINSGIAEYC